MYKTTPLTGIEDWNKHISMYKLPLPSWHSWFWKCLIYVYHYFHRLGLPWSFMTKQPPRHNSLIIQTSYFTKGIGQARKFNKRRNMTSLSSHSHTNWTCELSKSFRIWIWTKIINKKAMNIDPVWFHWNIHILYILNMLLYNIIFR